MRKAGLIVWIAGRSLRQHALSTVITAVSMALAAGLLMTVVQVNRQAYDAFTASHLGFDAVLGARGSELQLVLSGLFHLEASPGNVPWSVVQAIREHPMVDRAYPLATGDNYRGVRVVGVDDALFTDHAFGPDGNQRFEFEPGGRAFHPDRREAVVGAFAARQAGLRAGDSFHTYHGLTYDPGAAHENDVFLVVGVLAPTNSPADRVIWIPLEGYFRMAGHALMGAGERYVAQAGEPIPDEHKEASAVLITLRSPQAGMMLSQQINRQGNVATLAWPIGRIMAGLFDRLGWAHRVLTLVAYLVAIVAAGSILASLSNAMAQRRRELAVLRALGASRRTIFSVVIVEASAIALLGAAVGYLVYAGLMLGAVSVIRSQTGVVLDIYSFHPTLLWTPLAMTLLGALAGVVPALRAYATDVAHGLTPDA